MGREGGTPAQTYWHIGVKKSGTSCPNEGEGGGVEVIWTNPKEQLLFSGNLPLTYHFAISWIDENKDMLGDTFIMYEH